MRVVVIGAGGHARSVIEALRAQGLHEPVACTDPRADLRGAQLDGVPVVGDDARLGDLRADGVEGAVVGIGGVRDNGPRARVFALARELGFALPAVVHPAATVASSARLGDGTVVLPRAVLGPGAIVGDDVIVNTGALVEHDSTLADHVHVASGAVLGGHVRVGGGAHVGLGATVAQDVAIGRGAVVGAGAAVVRDVPDGAVVVGVPARPLDGA